MVDQTIGTRGHAPAAEQGAEQSGRGGIRDAMLVAGGIAFAASLGFSMVTGRIPELYAERDVIAPYMGRQSIDQSQIVASDGRNAIFGWDLWTDAQPLALRRIVFESLAGPAPAVAEFLGFLQHELAEQAHIDLAGISELFAGANAFEFAVSPVNGTYPAMAFSPGGGGGWTMGEGAAPVFFQWPSWLPVPSWLMPWVQQQSATPWLPPGSPPVTGMVVLSGPVTPYAPPHAAPPAAPPVTVAPAAPVAAPPPPAPAPEPVHYEPIVAAPEPAPVVFEPAPAAPPTVDVPVSNVVIDLGTTTPSTPEAPPSSSAPEPAVVAPQEPSGGSTSGGGLGQDDSTNNDSGSGIGDNTGNDNTGGGSTGNDSGGGNTNDSSGDGPSGSDGGAGQGNSGSDSGSDSNSGSGNSGSNNDSGSNDSGSNNDSGSGGDGGGGGSAGV